MRGGHDLDVDVEQVHHPLVLGTRDALERRDHRRLPVAAQHVAQRQPAGERIGVGIVVQQDEDAVGVAEEPLVLLDLETGQRPAELGEERSAEELGEGEVVELGELRLELFLALAGVRDADAEDVDQRAAGVPDGLEDLAQALAAVVLDDDAGAGREVGLEVGIGALEVAAGDVQTAVVQATRERLALDQELDFEAGQQDLVEHPDGQLRLADGETPHSVFVPCLLNPIHRRQTTIIRPVGLLGTGSLGRWVGALIAVSFVGIVGRHRSKPRYPATQRPS